MIFKSNTLIQFLIGCFLGLVSVIFWQVLAIEQFSLSIDNNNLPLIDVMRYGNPEVTWVKSPLSDRKLFQVTAPTVIDRNNIRADKQITKFV